MDIDKKKKIEFKSKKKKKAMKKLNLFYHTVMSSDQRNTIGLYVLYLYKRRRPIAICEPA